MIDNQYTVYECKDGRTRVYEKHTHKVTSYPRMIMEEYLGRPLSPDEDVHHIDQNPANNSIDNLMVLKKTDHLKQHAVKYVDCDMVCPICGKTFVWSALSQRRSHQNRNRKDRINRNCIGPFCSKKCAGTGSRIEQLIRDGKLNASKFGETLTHGNAEPSRLSEYINERCRDFTEAT